MSYHGNRGDGNGYDRSDSGGYERGGHGYRGRETHRTDRGGGGDYDRSRSRDNHDGRGFRGGGDNGRYRDGFRSDNGGRIQGDGRYGYGGRGGRGGARENRPSTMMVMSNFYQVEIDNRNMEVVMYEARIYWAKRMKKIDPMTRRPIEPWDFDFKTEEQMDIEKANILPRRILGKLNDKLRNENQTLVYDGSEMMYSSQRLFTEDDPMASMWEVQVGNDGSEAGRYGPGDTGGFKAPQARRILKKDFHVKVKLTCNEDDTFADCVKSSWFQVTLIEVGKIPFCHALDAILERRHQNEKEIKKVEVLRQAMDVMLKSSNFSIMVAPGKSPRRFYFKENEQESIIGPILGREFRNRRLIYEPLVGVSQAMRICKDGNIFVNADSCVNYFDREFYYQDQHDRSPKRNIPLLDDTGREGMICGIIVGDLSRPITDPRKRADIEKAIKKITFHVKYERVPTQEFVQRQRDKGKTDSQIRRMNTSVRRNKKMIQIIWSADDPRLYSFEYTQRTPQNLGPDGNIIEVPDQDLHPTVIHTVRSYFQTRYNIPLRYPHMPIVLTTKKKKNEKKNPEWYPIEFLSQAFGKSKDANSNSNIKTILSYYDSNGGTKCVQNVSCLVKKMLDLQPDDIFRQFGLSRSDNPVELKAKVLDLPKLEFSGGIPANLKNGSWDLRGKKFAKCATMESFAVIDLTGDTRSCSEAINNTLRIMQHHGIIMPQNIDAHHASEFVSYSPPRCNSPADILDAFRHVTNKSNDFFIFDSKGVYQKNKVWFKTYATNTSNGNLCEILLLPVSDNDNKEVFGMLKKEVWEPTHVVYRGDSQQDARLQVKVEVQDRTISVDPFNFRYIPCSHNEGHHEVFLEEISRWQRARWIGYQFKILAVNGPIYDEHDIRAVPTVKLEPWQVELCSMVFVFLKDKRTDTYHQVKMISQFEFGVPSQCIVKETFLSQRNRDQYCSNIALKCNTKLMNKNNNALAWDTSYDLGDNIKGIPWVNETPTMVIGIDVSPRLGQPMSIVGASVCLNPGCIQMGQTIKIQSRSDIIAKDTMKDITKNLWWQFYKHTGFKPLRVLVYRDGVSEGRFPILLETEIASMRQAFHEIHTSLGDFHCPNEDKCKKNGCVFCTPIITYVVSQSIHSIRIVPSQTGSGGGKEGKNVFSGTVVDDTIMDYRDGILALRGIPRELVENSEMMLFEETDDVGYDFLLTAQGGVKGTSKPIFYRVILNENAVWKANENCTPLDKKMLQLCTYHQSYQYGTATKSVRTVPVMYYSKRLVSMAMGYVSYLQGRLSMGTQEQDNQPRLTKCDPENKCMYVRSDINQEDPNYLPELKTELLPHFSPYHKQTETHHRTPFRLHISA